MLANCLFFSMCIVYKEMSNVLRPVVGGPGNDILFGNTVRASVAMIAYNTCSQKIVSHGESRVNVNALVAAGGGLKTIETFNAPVVVLTEADTEPNLALGVPNPIGITNECPAVVLTVINSSGNVQVFDPNPLLSNVKRTNVVNVMSVDCMYKFVYDPTAESWFPMCELAVIPPP